MRIVPSGQGRRAAWWLVAIVAILLLTPSVTLIEVKHDGAGWAMGTRSLVSVVAHGLRTTAARVELQRFDSLSNALQSVSIAGIGTATTAPCVVEITRGTGPFSLSRFFKWVGPADTEAEGLRAIRACTDLRESLAHRKGTLAAALISGDAAQVRRHLGDAIASTETLLVTQSDVGQPLSRQLARLLLDDDAGYPVTRLDAALLVGDARWIGKWLPPGALKPYQRYALFRLGLQDLARGHDSDPQRSGADPSVSWKDGYSSGDFFSANTHCDARFAEFLERKGLKPDETVVVDAFIGRLRLETPQAASQMSDAIGRYGQGLLGLSATRAAPADCIALARHYRGVALPASTIEDLGDMTGEQVLTRYQELAERESKGLHLQPHSKAEDEFYDRLRFDNAASPLPSLPGMFTAMLAGRPSGGAVCAALDATASLMDHDRARALFGELAESWRSKPLPDMPDLAQCTLSMVFPPSLFARETAERNAFLHRAGIACTVALPTEQDPYSEKVTCDNDR